MSMYTKRAQRLGKIYDNEVRLRGDKDEALDAAIKKVYPLYSDDAQADVYASVADAFQKYPMGISRRIALTTALRNYHNRRARGQ